ncbi:hypothetical protein EDB84DRAFT_901663 [Lactarius hengduanensis]|nr:hypothetical protein EDB84DRAFT_901663 [Lactarius hengduanensis]
MASTDDVSLSEYTIPAAPNEPYPPPSVEAKYFYYGIPSQPRLVARSSTDVWLVPTGPEAYLDPKESSPLGSHPLQMIWEASVGPAMHDYLGSKGVEWTSLDPVRLGYSGDTSPPAIVWIGVVPGSLSAEEGVEVATHCERILVAHHIDDVHIEIRESEVFRSAGHKMYNPAATSDGTVRVQEPFSTTLGLPICAEVTPFIEGTGGFFITDPRNPGKLYLVTARHVVFHPDEDPNVLYQHCDSSQHRRNVLLFGDTATEKYLKAIESEIDGKHVIATHLEGRLEAAKQKSEDVAKRERRQAVPQLEDARERIEDLKKFLVDISREDWKKQENRIIGHVVLSPPTGFGVGEEGFTEDWAVIEIDDGIIDLTNFTGNTIDLGIDPIDKFPTWMSPHPAIPPSFEYSKHRFLQVNGTIPDEEMWKPSLKTLDHDHDLYTMVIKRGYGSDLTVGPLNTIRSFTRVYLKGQPSQMSKEVAVLPRGPWSGLFSSPGDSGSAVVDGKGRLAGLITGGAGVSDVSDCHCTYLTSINFVVKRMLGYGLKASLFSFMD